MARSFASRAALAAVLTLTLWPGGVHAGSLPIGSAFAPDEILIGLRPEAAEAVPSRARILGKLGIPSLDRLGAEIGVRSIQRVFAADVAADPLAVQEGLPNVLKLTLAPGTDLFAAIRRYAADPNVEYAEPNRIYTALKTPSDSSFGKQWGLHNTGQSGGKADADIDAPEAWDVQKGQPRVIIAIIDTGVDYNHPELAGGRVLTSLGRDFANGDNDAMDDHGHGTYVAGIAAANSDNGAGMAGICWGCRILPVKVLNADGQGSADSVAKGIQYAASQNAQILSMSLGYKSDCGCSLTVARAINYAYEKGSLLIAAAGNDSDKTRTSYPGSSPRVLAVGATDRSDKEADFSNRDANLDIMAPGKDIFSLDLSTNSPMYRTASGTSAATPFVSGVAGLVWSAHPSFNNGQVWRILRATADRLPGLPGRLNARAALAVAAGGRPFAAAVDKCNTEPSCPPGCGAEVALAGPGAVDYGEALGVLRTLRSQVLRKTPLGRQWVDLYARHRMEVAAIFLADDAFRTETRQALQLWMPLLRAASQRMAEPVPVTDNHIRAARSVIEGLMTRGSAPLQRDLQDALKVLDSRMLVIGKDQDELIRELDTP